MSDHHENALDASGFEWDENKRKSNIENHRIDFVDAAIVLLGKNVDVPSSRSGEERRKSTGLLNGTMITVVYVVRGDCFRIISARRAWKNEQRAYRQVYG